jgi:hypothetical protein
MQIGQKIKTIDGFDGVVVSNASQSYYGHCPEGMVIVRLDSGVTVRALSEIKEQE